MKLSEFQGEDALEVLANIIDPACEILSDPKVQPLYKKRNIIGIVKVMLKDHKKSTIEILAALDGVPVDEYKVNVATLPLKLLELINDKELQSFFSSADVTEGQTSSIVSAENTEVPEE